MGLADRRLAAERRDDNMVRQIVEHYEVHAAMPSYRELGQRLHTDSGTAFRRVQRLAARAKLSPAGMEKLRQFSEQTGLELDFLLALKDEALRNKDVAHAAPVAPTAPTPPTPTVAPTAPTDNVAPTAFVPRETEPAPRAPSIPPPNEFPERRPEAPSRPTRFKLSGFLPECPFPT